MTDENQPQFDRRSFMKRSAVGAFGLAGWAAGDVETLDAPRDEKSEVNGLAQGTGNGTGQGTGNGTGQGGDRPFYIRRMVFPYPERLGRDIRQKLIIVTDRKDQRPDQLQGVDQNEVGQCNFGSGWPPANLNVWEGIIVDWRNAGRLTGFYGGNPTVRATQLVERNTIFVEGQPTDIPLGTPYIVSRVHQCPGDLVGVEARKVPGVEVKTGPGVSTGESTGSN